ncbi:hypothetical protein [Acinetobacter indicus]|uniref:Uncharacterized protein n=1 Tax=Acinetobacter indicus TaxID=756892 RepID=A0A6C0Y3K5_9GAMM|nr:hypothetical protein [Acinetobacter indicus]QIC70774.1 hypothetical protein FSC09_10295 [Acinetobacter indicus]
MNLTIEQMRKIVDGAPEWAKYWITRDQYHGHILSFPNMTGHSSYLLSDLRAALADHDRTDHCSDIKNHISPTTVVIER